jgi:hypothetical protein
MDRAQYQRDGYTGKRSCSSWGLKRGNGNGMRGSGEKDAAVPAMKSCSGVSSEGKRHESVEWRTCKWH